MADLWHSHLQNTGVVYWMIDSGWIMTDLGVAYLLYWVKVVAAVYFVDVTGAGQQAQGVWGGLGFELWGAELDHVLPETRSNLVSE